MRALLIMSVVVSSRGGRVAERRGEDKKNRSQKL